MAFTRFARIAGILALSAFGVLALVSADARADSTGIRYIGALDTGSSGDLPPRPARN